MDSILKRVTQRIYSDYLMPSRLNEYERLIETALGINYKHVSVIEFYDVLKQGLKKGEKYFIRRHDVDTDVKTAEEMFRIEQRLGVNSSFYFRLSTVDINLMKEIQNNGSEASFHYEEISDFAKQKKLKSKKDVDNNLQEIQNQFVQHYTTLQNKLGYKLRSVASHGDFVNRKLQIPNHYLLTNELKNKLGIEVEAYDSTLLNAYRAILTDEPYPKHYSPTNPFEVLKNNIQVVYLLTHPRHWRSNILINTKDNVKRFYEGLMYGIG